MVFEYVFSFNIHHRNWFVTLSGTKVEVGKPKIKIEQIFIAKSVQFCYIPPIMPEKK